MSRQLDSVRRFLAQQRSPGPRPEEGVAIVAGSGKGGTGTSSIVALLGLAAADAGREVLLVDANENVGTLHLLLGVSAGPGLGALRGGSATPYDLMVPVTDRLRLLTTQAPDGEAPVSGAERRVLLRRIAESYGDFDLVLVDGGSRLEGVLGACLANARLLLAFTATDRISLAATHALVKAVHRSLPGLPVLVAVNRCGLAEAEAAIEILRMAAGHFLTCTIDYAGAVPDDPRFYQAIAAGRMIQEAAAGSPIGAAVRAMEARLLDGLQGWRGAAPASAISQARE